MSWGDPFGKLYKDDQAVRHNGVVDDRFCPGALVTYGDHFFEAIIWSAPDFKSPTQTLRRFGDNIRTLVATIICVDCETDPTNNWVYLMFTCDDVTKLGWLPTTMLRAVEE